MTSNQNKTKFTRNRTEEVSNILYGKIPPQTRELEEAVLGAILIEKDAMSNIADILRPEAFYVDAHATIFETCLELFKNSMPIDLLSVTEALRGKAKLEEIGGAYYLSELTNKVASSANIEYHARIILQKYLQREVIRISNDAIRDAYEDTTDVFEMLDNISLSFDNINNTLHGSTLYTGLQVVNKIKTNLINPPEQPKFVQAILGIKHLLGTVDCYAAKPGTGKTEIMVESALLEAISGNNVGILSLELHNELLMAKMMHHYTGVFANKIIENNVQGEYLETVLSADYKVMERIKIDDSKVTNLNIRSKIITLVKKYGCRSIWIDYIQLCKMIREYHGQTDVACMESMMHNLQRTAKELDCAIIPLSQLKRGKEEPTMEDIRGGGIEAACSKIYLVEDPNIKTNFNKEWDEIEVDRGLIEFVNVKARFGDKGKIRAYYDKPRQKISLWTDVRPGEYLSQMREEKSHIF